jgi:hypothetical protein
MMPRALFAAAVALVVTAAATGARAAPPSAGDPGPTAYVLTFGPGNHPFFKFGHNAIWLHDPAAESDRVYNFGTFSFESPRLILDFLGGRLTYWLSVAPLPGVLAGYQRENRSISAQRLALTPDESRQLRQRLQENARPENRAYKYDYFLDNCSTRVRDVVDTVVGGRLRETGRLPGRMTLRQHALRMAAEPLWLYLALDLILGPTADRPIDRWGEMFLPEELAHGLAATTTASGAPLVAGTDTLFSAARPPPRAAPPRRAPTFLIAGTLFGLFLVALTAGRGAGARVLFGVVIALWGLVVGFIGCFLGYAWLFTDHVVAHRNQNILLCAPWALALAGLGIGVAAGWAGATRLARKLAAAALAAAVAAVVIKVGVAPRQENVALIAFFLPAWMGVTGGLARLQRGSTGARDLRGVRASGRSRP